MAPKKPVSISNRKSTPIVKRDKIPLYFLACEGGTEIIYFEGLKNYLWEEKGIKINIRYLDRTYSERNRTSPLDLLNLIFEEKDCADFEEISVEKIIYIVDQWMRDQHIIPDNKLKNVFEHVADKIIGRMERRYHFAREIIKFSDIDNEKTNILFDDLKKCIDSVLADSITEYNLEDFREYLRLKLGNIGYEDGDKVCLICDRDFYDDSLYEDALKQCEKENIGFFITNPCFEFWILLHFDEVISIDTDKLRENPMVPSSVPMQMERYTLTEVKKLCPDYQKGQIPFYIFQNKIDHAIETEKFYSENEIELKSDIGSRVGILVSELMGLERKDEI